MLKPTHHAKNPCDTAQNSEVGSCKVRKTTENYRGELSKWRKDIRKHVSTRRKVKFMNKAVYSSATHPLVPVWSQGLVRPDALNRMR